MERESGSPAPGWYLQASHPGYERWWDGTSWFEHLRPAYAENDPISREVVAPDVREPVEHEHQTEPSAKAIEAAPEQAAGAGLFALLDRLPPKRLPRWAKLLIPLGVVGILVGVVVVTPILHVPSEADYRNGFSDIATALIDSGSTWTQPAPHPSPLSSSDQELYEQVKTIFLDDTCADLGKGDDAIKSSINIYMAASADQGQSEDFALASQQAQIEAAAKYICPRYAGTADKALGYILSIRAFGP